MADRPPPTYEEATGSSSSSRPAAGSQAQNTSSGNHLTVPGDDTLAARRSMEDETRPLPTGWVRSYDPENDHQFFVDTTKDPPRSTWVHPYDDDEYLSSLSSADRQRIEREGIQYQRDHPETREDLIHAHSDLDDDDDYLPAIYQDQVAKNHRASSSRPSQRQEQPLPPRPEAQGQNKVSFGRKLKDKVTGMTHEQREQERRNRAEEDRRMYELHIKLRQAMRRAIETGEPQLVGKDRDGRDMYIEPPRPPYAGGGYGTGGYGYSPYHPYNSQGIYTTPNARYMRPAMPYARPYGRPYGPCGGRMGGGYGGAGMGLPLAGGLLGGAMLGGLMF